MSDQTARFALRIPSDVSQQELWDLNDHINTIQGVTADLQDNKNLVYDTIMMVITIVGPVLTLAEGAKSVYELAQLLYEFTHKEEEKGHHVTINKNGTEIEIKNVSIEDIKKILQEM